MSTRDLPEPDADGSQFTREGLGAHRDRRSGKMDRGTMFQDVGTINHKDEYVIEVDLPTESQKDEKNVRVSVAYRGGGFEFDITPAEAIELGDWLREMGQRQMPRLEPTIEDELDIEVEHFQYLEKKGLGPFVAVTEDEDE